MQMPTRALVFDSAYDQYRGVVAFVRMVDGSFSAREGLRTMATGTRFDAEELGYFSPTMTPVEALTAGEVGYVVTGLKDVSLLRVGDTLTSVKRPATCCNSRSPISWPRVSLRDLKLSRSRKNTAPCR